MSAVMTPNEQREGRHRIGAKNKKTENLNFVVAQAYFWCQGHGYRRDRAIKKNCNFHPGHLCLNVSKCARGRLTTRVVLR